MSRLYFHLTNGVERIVDEEGVEVSNADVLQMTETIREVWQEEPELFDADDSWRIEVVDGEGRIIGTFDVAAISKADALAAVATVRHRYIH